MSELPVGSFAWLCDQLGYAPKNVLDMRLNATEIYVTYRDDQGHIHTQGHEIQQVSDLDS